MFHHFQHVWFKPVVVGLHFLSIVHINNGIQHPLVSWGEWPAGGQSPPLEDGGANLVVVHDTTAMVVHMVKFTIHSS